MPEITTLGFVIKPTYEGEPNTNAFTDPEKAKLAAIPAAADIATTSDIPNAAEIKTLYESNADTNAFTDAEKTKLDTLDTSDFVPTSRQINGYDLTGNITISQEDIGLGNVNNTSDADKPVSTAQQTALNLKVSSDITGITGASRILNIVSISQANYDALDTAIKNANTFLIPVE